MLKNASMRPNYSKKPKLAIFLMIKMMTFRTITMRMTRKIFGRNNMETTTALLSIV